MSRPLLAALIVCLSLAACSDKGQAPVSTPTKGGDAEVLRAPEPKQASDTLQKVLARGRLNCGVSGDQPGFSYPDNRDVWRGFDADFCRALAAAVLGDARDVNYTVLDERTRFAALQSGVVDVLASQTAWTFTRDAALGVDFVGVSYYDSQGFLAPKAQAFTGAADLASRRICVTAGAHQASLTDWFRARAMTYTPILAPSDDEALNAYKAGSCDALSGNLSALAWARLRLPSPDAHVLLPDAIAKEPLGPVVREGDNGWEDIVRWTLNALILAEEAGVTSGTVADVRHNSTDPDVRRLLGADGAYGRLLGLHDDWAFRAIRQVGSYGEIFDRNLGSGSPLKLPRGPNALSTATPPGLMYSPPMR